MKVRKKKRGKIFREKQRKLITNLLTQPSRFTQLITKFRVTFLVSSSCFGVSKSLSLSYSPTNIVSCEVTHLKGSHRHSKLGENLVDLVRKALKGEEMRV
jgi:hypothetical protein